MTKPFSIGLKLAPLLAAGLFCLGTTAAQAQDVTAGPDSVAVTAGPAVPDSVRRTERLFGLRLTRPQKAVILAAVLPGAGQVYNRKYWKLPLVYGALGGTIYGQIYFGGLYREFKIGDDLREKRVLAEALSPPNPELVAEFRDPGPRSGDDRRGLTDNAAGDALHQQYFNRYRNRRDVYFAYIAIAYGLQIVDALVDGHLYEFDVSDNLSLRVEPYALPLYGKPTIGSAFTFTLRTPPASGIPRRF